MPSHRQLRLLTLVQKGPGIAPNQRFRHEQWAPILAREHDIHLAFEPFESPELTDVLYRPGRTLRKAGLVLRDARRRWRARHHAHTFDGVIVLREAALIGGAWFERYLARHRIPFLYDFDDAIWRMPDTGRNGVFALARFPWKVGGICRLAARVTVGSAHLAEFARRFTSRVTVIPTTIDLSAYHVHPPPPPDGPFTIVWTGSHSTLPHLTPLFPVLRAVAHDVPMRLRVVCDTPPPPCDGVTTEFVPWRAASEAADLAPGHVGIMPLPDTPSTRGKCGCKALQYMGIGRPAIVSSVGVNRDIIAHDVNGLRADTPEQWIDALRRLAADPALRDRLGAAGRRTVEERFSAAVAAQALAGVARQTFGGAS